MRPLSASEAHAGEIERLGDALTRAEVRIDALLAQSDGLRDQLMVVEAKLVQAEQAKAEAEQDRAEADERATDALDRATGLDNLLADAERRLTESDAARRTAQERLDAMDRADTARRGQGRWARLRSAWRGE